MKFLLYHQSYIHQSTIHLHWQTGSADLGKPHLKMLDINPWPANQKIIKEISILCNFCYMCVGGKVCSSVFQNHKYLKQNRRKDAKKKKTKKTKMKNREEKKNRRKQKTHFVIFCFFFVFFCFA